MKSVLIIQTAFIGDVILATSLIESLHQAYGKACEIDVLVRKGNETLLVNHPYLRKVYCWDKKNGKYKDLLRVGKELRKNKYTRIYNLQRFASTGILALGLKAELKVGFAKNPLSFMFNRKVEHQIGNGKHEIERNFEQISPDLPPENQEPKLPKLYPSSADYKKIETYTQQGDYVVMAPASVWFTKRLPEEKWKELIQLYANKQTVYLIGAPNDAALNNRLIEESGSKNAINLAGELNLLQSAALIEQSAMAYVNDSAPLHLASATGAPVTAFFCSTVPSFGFGPLSAQSTICEVKENLSCRPCGLHGYKTCPEGHFKCGHDIEINAALTINR